MQRARDGGSSAVGTQNRGHPGIRPLDDGRQDVRLSPATTDLRITMRLAEPLEPFDWLRSA